MRQGMPVPLALGSSTTAADPTPSPIPGASILGFGYNVVTATSMTDTTQRIVAINEAQGTNVTKGGIQYLLPANVSLIDNNTSSIQYNVFASQAEYASHLAAQVNASVSAWGFSGDFAASYSSLSEGSQASLYGLVEADTTLWEVAIQQLQSLSLDPTFQEELGALPPTYSPDTGQAFFDFFEKYGTHVVTKASAGGYLHYTVAVSGASSFSKQTAQANMKLEYKSVFIDASANAQSDWSQMDKSWISSRNASLSVQGGDPSILENAIPPNDPTTPVNYSALVGQWTRGVMQAPGVTGVHLQPISHLAPAGQVAALDAALDAYLNDGVTVSGRATLNEDTKTVWTVSDSACSIEINRNYVQVPPEPMGSTGTTPFYWLVLADNAGKVVFNQAVFKDDPDQLDALIETVISMSAGQNWWTVVVQCGATNPPSAKAVQWLNSCGINLSNDPYHGDFDPEYPHWPTLAVAVGKTNSPEFQGRIEGAYIAYGEANSPPYSRGFQVKAALPSHVAYVTS
jgi:hypothetical protein